MKLSVFVAEKRREILDDLKAGQAPREGRFDEVALREGRTKGAPQTGSTRFAPHSVFLEFIFPDPKAASQVLTVEIESPERIVFMPVPGWVIESIWQGEIDGSFQFEADARSELAAFAGLLEPEANRELFGPKAATRRE